MAIKFNSFLLFKVAINPTFQYFVLPFINSSSRRIHSFSSAPMHDNPANTPILNASDLVDGIEIYNVYEAGGKKISLSIDNKSYNVNRNISLVNSDVII